MAGRALESRLRLESILRRAHILSLRSGQMVRRMSATAEHTFLDEVFSRRRPGRARSAQRRAAGHQGRVGRGRRTVTRRRVQDTTVAGSGDPGSVAGGGRDHQPHPALVRVGAAGVCLVPVAANPGLRRSDCRRPGSCRAVGTLEELPRWNRRRRIRVKLTGFVYRAHNPRWAFAPDSGQGAASAGGRFNPVGMPALYTVPEVRDRVA